MKLHVASRLIEIRISHLAGCVAPAVFLLLLVDSFVRPPFGFMWLRKLAGVGLHHTPLNPQDPPPACGWDFEASWQIGIMRGSSPWEWGPSGINTPAPAITCAHLGTSPAVSFVADPFLLRASPKEWYLFYEHKNLERFIGEIG